MEKFSELELKPFVREAIDKKGFSDMTEIQAKMLPVALAGEDVIGQAPTGTGKTLAFAITIAEHLTDEATIQALVLSPTRELTVQTASVFREMLASSRFRVTAIYGGESYDRQFQALDRHPQVVVATPGRLIDLLNRGSLALGSVRTLVLDEADNMLDLGFREDLDTILSRLTSPHQTLLLSATISDEVRAIATKHLSARPVEISTSPEKLTVDNIEQKYIIVREEDKVELISRLLDINHFKLVMIFCNTKKAVDEVSSKLAMRSYNVEELHGDMKQMQRDRVMDRFKTGLVSILVASDVAARGLDVSGVDCVINYDIPLDDEYYVHRIGRTGRANRKGLAITLLSLRERYLLRAIVAYSKATITPMPIPSLASVLRARVGDVLAQAEALADPETPGKHQDIIDEAVSSLVAQGFPLENLVKGFLRVALHNFENDEDITLVSAPEPQERRNRSSSATGSRFFINIGTRDGLSLNVFCNLIAQALGANARDIHDVDLHESFSFFTVPTAAAPKVFRSLSGMRYHDRKVNVEKADPKTPSASRSRGPYRPGGHDHANASDHAHASDHASEKTEGQKRPWKHADGDKRKPRAPHRDKTQAHYRKDEQE